MFVNELLSGDCGFPCEWLALDAEVPSGAFATSSPTGVLLEEAKPAMVPFDRRLLRLAFESIAVRDERVEDVEDSMLTTPDDLDTTILWLRKEAEGCSSWTPNLSAFYTSTPVLSRA